ncbi:MULTISPECIES: maleylpyruvate isomerase family mycothiol-dependent enzyme [Pseudonocardia]|uniref:Mycothiol-dependent maleylpyruvate isomerase n=2 Tax=Pseudonocardia TaxID=1847 RepID=A0A1Y2MNC9_PSEAH|nr:MULTISPECIES: maleylpyruvate isomerase family mycothiol-dependent enzyme [Pseudonocardia]OSY36756.1 mycothiol-dependent maleylpyruvate isomerase [Pseudonocardia autotrophica]TDN77129.1 maleylpyruvate isomerase [Pseudonocardia autotrophica]BBG01134.1 maleylpyruvate isomerase [Pseudonocardia autotrophica]GEC26810.1 maleylpyruvate isomerase [Pseudonocardia saturnea]
MSGAPPAAEITVPPPLADSLAWAGDGQAHLRGLMTRMGGEAFTAPSLLTGWTRAHVLTHVARNADAMCNLLTWARTGTETPAYRSPQARDADIAAGAARGPDEIRADVVASSDRLADVVRAMPARSWSARVRTAQGVEIPVTAVPWLRAREVWIHAVDLDVGASFADLPIPMRQVLVADVVAHLERSPGCPHVRLEESRTGQVLEFGPGPALDGSALADLGTIRGRGPDLVAWVLGRPFGKGLRDAEGNLPGPLPSWL